MKNTKGRLDYGKKTAATILERVKNFFVSNEFRAKCRRAATDFSRKRLLSFTTVTACIINLIRKSLQLEVSSFLKLLRIPDASKQAFSQARKKLLPETFKILNEKLITEFYSDNQIHTFKGYRVLAVDGSSLFLPDTKEL